MNASDFRHGSLLSRTLPSESTDAAKAAAAATARQQVGAAEQQERSGCKYNTKGVRVRLLKPSPRTHHWGPQSIPNLARCLQFARTTSSARISVSDPVLPIDSNALESCSNDLKVGGLSTMTGGRKPMASAFMVTSRTMNP